MLSLLDSIYMVVILFLTVLTILFFIARKKENSPTKLKFLITILLVISLIIFVLNSLSSLTRSSELLISSDILINNIIFFLLCFSTALFIYSIHNAGEDVVELEDPPFFKSRKGKIKVGKVMKGSNQKHNFFLSLKDLEKHMFICGATGTGKTTFLQNFLMNFKKHFNIPFMLVEFKGEYHFLQRKIEDLLIIRPGENFSINIFNPGTSLPEVHAERIFDILKSGKFLDENAEFSPQMEKVLVEILTKVCENKQFQSWKGFYQYCKGYAKNKKNEIPMLSQTLISIKNRIRRFSLGSLKAIFDTDHEIKVKNIFERNILIDLSSIIRLGGEKEDALFFLNMLLKYLWDKNLTRGAFNFKGIKHITIVEDTQYFAPKDLTRQNKLTTYLEDIALLQRGTGECLISLATHPDISQEILANCGVLVCFKSHIEKEFLCKLLNLDVEHEDYLSILEEGQCIIRVNSIKRPFLLKVPFIKRSWLDNSEIKRNNKKILGNYKKIGNESKKSPDFRPLNPIKKLNQVVHT
ncbi:MAG: AAA-like domain protein [Candidatus Lokiarchaeum sp. GC14_75]|nr:MAG: AAA-like domain protein [Candidatus Lokiarchaeum sp. GC14_75]